MGRRAEGARPRARRHLDRDGDAGHDGHELAGMVALPGRGARGRPAPGRDLGAVLARVLAGYREELPILPGAAEAVEGLAARWPLGLASSSNREAIELVLSYPGSGATSRYRCRPRRSPAASRSRTSTSRPPVGSTSPRTDASRSRTRERDPLRARGGDAGDRRAQRRVPACGGGGRFADRVIGSLAELSPALVESLDR